ncbi:hypothetical protein [Streptomyces hokutonensis]|uniref:Uncharacterized protein n=1 Tax=Streptomyces hokutonensis TaxID=1306990 RepID=A0ABW6M765_9ACTN
MTDNAEDFDDIVDGITTTSTLYGAIQEARAKLHREHPGGIDVAKIGHEAWRQLTPVQQARALPELFTAYVIRLHDEERAQQLDTAAADETKTYLEPDDEHLLADSLSGAESIGPDAEVDGVSASALSNVLSELDLLRHRLAMTRREH